MAAGLAKIILWVYFNARTTQKNDMKFIAKQPCKCAICTHGGGLCLEQKYACCMVAEGESTVGRISNARR